MKSLFSKFAQQIQILSNGIGIHCCWKNGPFLVQEKRLPEIYTKHRCEFCDAVKKHPGAENRCRYHDALILGDRIAELGGIPFIALCPAGACDLVVPFYCQGNHLGAVLVGPFRLPGKSTEIEPEKFEHLIVIERNHALQIAELVSAFLKPTIELIYPEGHPRDKRFAAACEYLHEHFAEKISADRVAKKVGLSRSRFLHCFSEQCGRSFAQELTLIRLENARRQMRNTDNSLEQIAIQCGFTSQSHFSVIFKQEYGATPRQWRSRQLGVKVARTEL